MGRNAMNRSPGQGRLIVDADSHAKVQTAFVDVDETASRYSSPEQDTSAD